MSALAVSGGAPDVCVLCSVASPEVFNDADLSLDPCITHRAGFPVAIGPPEDADLPFDACVPCGAAFLEFASDADAAALLSNL